MRRLEVKFGSGRIHMRCDVSRKHRGFSSKIHMRTPVTKLPRTLQNELSSAFLAAYSINSLEITAESEVKPSHRSTAHAPRQSHGIHTRTQLLGLGMLSMLETEHTQWERDRLLWKMLPRTGCVLYEQKNS
jgi:hypothetical protein